MFDFCWRRKVQSLTLLFKNGQQICFVAVVLQHRSHLLQDNDGVSQMEHEVCVFVCVSGGEGGPNESPMGYYRYLSPALSNNKHQRFTAP